MNSKILTFRAAIGRLKSRSGVVYLIALLNMPLSNAFGQKEITIVLECVEYIGNDKYIANFGYNNPNKVEVIVPETNSSIIYNEGALKKSALNKFKPGRQTYVFKNEFTSKERVLWRVTLPNGVIKETSASANSNHCKGSGNILPYYPPPANGKILNSIIGPELTSLYQTYTSTNNAVSNDIFQIRGSEVLIEVRPKGTNYNYVLNLLTQNNFSLELGDPVKKLIIGWYPIRNLTILNNYPAYIELTRPVYPSYSNNSGRALNLGDFSMRSDYVRNGYGLTGKGVKVGVLSDSYNSKSAANNDVLNGDLPGTGNIDGNLQQVESVKDFTGTFRTLSDEGRAMLQIVHDIAPGADLAFRTGFLSPADMALGISELANRGSNIIVDDITHITEPFFRDGIISKAVDDVVSRGVTYFTAAGNFGKKSYSKQFSPFSGKTPSGISGVVHDFGNGDIYQNISLAEGNYLIVMQWVDDVNARNDFDIYLANDNGTTLFGFNRVNTGTEPIEILPFTVQGGNASTNILITRASGSVNALIKYVVFRGDMVINQFSTGTSTIVGQANSAGAITVGAVKYDNTPYYGVNPPTIASFSSTGGTIVNGVLRQKPDFTAPNGVNTTVKLSSFDLDGDGNFDFYGTSAAAPHAAAVAALLTEARKKYENSVLSPSQSRQLLSSTALDMDVTGFDLQQVMGLYRQMLRYLPLQFQNPNSPSLVVPGANVLPGDPRSHLRQKATI